MNKKPLILFAALLALVGCGSNDNPSSEESSLPENDSSSTESNFEGSSSTVSNFEGYELLDVWPAARICEDLGTESELPAFVANSYYYISGYDTYDDLCAYIVVENADSTATNTYIETLSNAGFINYETGYEDEGYYNYYNEEYDVYFELSEGNFYIYIYTSSETEEYTILTSWPAEQIRDYLGVTSLLPEYKANEYYYMETSDENFGDYAEVAIQDVSSSELSEYLNVLVNADFINYETGYEDEDFYNYYNDEYDIYLELYEGVLFIDVYNTYLY